MNELYLTRETELNILGNWLQGRHCEDIALLEPTLFADHKALYAAAVEGSKTLLQLFTEAKNDGVAISDMLKISNPGGDIGVLANIDYMQAKAEALTCQRNRLVRALSDPAADIPSITSKLLKTQAVIDQREVKPAAANLSANFMKQLEEELAAKTMKYGRGFEQLTKRAGSIKRGQLIVLGARPATGKSAAALQIGYNIASKGAKVLFFPLEMTTQETLARLILQQQIVGGQTELKAPTDKEKQDISSFLDQVEAAGNFLIYEGVNNLETIIQTIKEQQPDFVVIDQLTQVRTATKTKDIRERYIEVTADLKAAAMEHNTAILLLSQLNRAATDRSAPTLENLHESDATGQNADIVLLMVKKEPDEKTPDFARSDRIIIHVVKNRGGASGFRIETIFNGDRYTFSPVSY